MRKSNSCCHCNIRRRMARIERKCDRILTMMFARSNTHKNDEEEYMSKLKRVTEEMLYMSEQERRRLENIVNDE